MAKEYSPEILALRGRVIVGNDKLNGAWEIIKTIEDKGRWQQELDRWTEANEKLSNLCRQLKLMGYVDCLYLDGNGKKTRKCLDGLGCRVCPSSTPYWEQELMLLPSPKV